MTRHIPEDLIFQNTTVRTTDLTLSLQCYKTDQRWCDIQHVTRVPQQNVLEEPIMQTYNGKSANYMDLISVGVCQLWVQISHRIVIARVDICMIKTIIN